MPAGRPLSADAVYARELGWMHKRSYKRVRALGGAAKLKAMDEEAREVLLRPKGNRPRKGGIVTRRAPQVKRKDDLVESAIRMLLHQRGLLPDDLPAPKVVPSATKAPVGMTVNRALKESGSTPAFVSGGRAVYHKDPRWKAAHDPTVELDPNL